VYREFCVRVLVKSQAFERYATYEQGLDLFEIAQASLPQRDRTLEHHRGRWIKNRGHDPLLALQVLNNALNLSGAPYADRVESEAHIYTSLAATALDATEKGLFDFSEGAKQALGYIDQAKRLQPFNSHAVHVRANILVRVAERLKGSDPAGSMAVATSSLADVDRMLILLSRSSGLSVSDDIKALEEVRHKIIETAGLGDDPAGTALAMWKAFRRQEGFCVWLRTLYSRARKNEKGTRFKEAFGYFETVRTQIERDGGSVGSDLAAAALCTYYDWRVRQIGGRKGDISINWTSLLELAMKTGEAEKDVFFRYVQGLSLAHLNRWQEANACFMQNRRGDIPSAVLHEERDRLMSEVGAVRLVQGTIRTAAGKSTLKCAELQTDFLLGQKYSWGRDGEIAHVEIAFSFAGPVGTHPRPQ
jgi:hypothetical protein